MESHITELFETPGSCHTLCVSHSPCRYDKIPERSKGEEDAIVSPSPGMRSIMVKSCWHQLAHIWVDQEADSGLEVGLACELHSLPPQRPTSFRFYNLSKQVQTH